MNVEPAADDVVPAVTGTYLDTVPGYSEELSGPFRQIGHFGPVENMTAQGGSGRSEKGVTIAPGGAVTQGGELLSHHCCAG